METGQLHEVTQEPELEGCIAVDRNRDADELPPLA